MRRPVVLATALLGVLAVSGAALAVGGLGQARQGVPLVQVHFEFKVEERATHYTVVNTGDSRGSLDLAAATYSWTLTPPDNDPPCNNRGVLTGTGKEFVWRHGNKGDQISDDACDHDIGLPGIGHPGDIDVVVKDATWSCTAGYTGTQAADGSTTGDGSDGDCTNIAPPPTKARDCDEERAALAAAEAKLAALAELEKQAWAEFDKATDRVRDAVAAIDKLNGVAGLVDIVTLGGSNERVFTEVYEAKAALTTIYGAYLVVVRKRAAADKDVVRASKALNACLGVKVRRAEARSSMSVCGPQRVALAAREARLAVYESFARVVKRTDFAVMRKGLLHARALVVRAKAGPLPPKVDRRQALVALGHAAAAVGRAAAAVGTLDVVVRNLLAKVKPAEKQVAKAKAALAACQK